MDKQGDVQDLTLLVALIIAVVLAVGEGLCLEGHEVDVLSDLDYMHM